MEEQQATLPLAAVPAQEELSKSPLSRWAALFETLLVCGVPTQAMIGAALILLARMPLLDDNGLSLRFFATLSLIDTLLVGALIHVFLRASGERPRDVFIGARSVSREAARGLALLPVVFLAVSAVVLTLRALFPWMHTVEDNPLAAFLDSPVEAAVFLVVVVLAGGVREELQRAFILHRFEQRLGGVRLGLVLFTIAFGALHLDQGVDVSIAVGLLGLLWGVIYIRRRSAILPMTNHASFNAMQVAQGLLAKSLGG